MAEGGVLGYEGTGYSEGYRSYIRTCLCVEYVHRTVIAYVHVHVVAYVHAEGGVLRYEGTGYSEGYGPYIRTC